MTAEVAIINRQAIALAADSAVTVNTLGRTKIYNSANKLFALSNHHPVGVMIFGGAQLTGVPWETLIKVYRSQLGSKGFSKLSDYCDDFIRFLTENLNFFRDADQSLSIQLIAYEKFSEIVSQIRKSIADKINQNGEISTREIGNLVGKAIGQSAKNLSEMTFLPEFDENLRDEIAQKYKESFKEIAQEVFEKLNITRSNMEKLTGIAANALTKEFSRNLSGIVIAGFGQEEVFPGLYTYEIESVFEGKIKYRKNSDKSYENTSEAEIIPFAQEEMIFTFVTGIDPYLERLSLSFLDKTLRNFFNVMIPEAQGSQQEKDRQKQLNNLVSQLVEDFYDQLRQYKLNSHIAPILNTVSILPKEELAAMAEALVSLTSLKRRVSTDAETVGGPTDVALISKGDGFVWVQRKHYFDADLNPGFFAKRFGSMIALRDGGE
jgi:hypothetical protein